MKNLYLEVLDQLYGHVERDRDNGAVKGDRSQEDEQPNNNAMFRIKQHSG